MCTSRDFQLGKQYKINGKPYIFAQTGNGGVNFIDPQGGPPAMQKDLTKGDGITEQSGKTVTTYMTNYDYNREHSLAAAEPYEPESVPGSSSTASRLRIPAGTQITLNHDIEITPAESELLPAGAL